MQAGRPKKPQLLRASCFCTQKLLLLVPALRTYAVFVQSDTTQGTAVFGTFGLARRTLHPAGGGTILDALLLVDLQDCGQQRIIFPQNQSVIEILAGLFLAGTL